MGLYEGFVIVKSTVVCGADEYRNQNYETNDFDISNPMTLDHSRLGSKKIMTVTHQFRFEFFFSKKVLPRPEDLRKPLPWETMKDFSWSNPRLCVVRTITVINTMRPMTLIFQT